MATLGHRNTFEFDWVKQNGFMGYNGSYEVSGTAAAFNESLLLFGG